MLHKLYLAAALLFLLVSNAQEMPLEHSFGEKYNDRYKYSNLLLFSETGSGAKVLVRAFYTGLLLRPKGYLIERYSRDMEFVDEYSYKFNTGDFVHGFVANGQLYLIFLEYDQDEGEYVYSVHQTPVEGNQFKQSRLLSIKADYEENALDKNYYNRNFKTGFSTTLLSDQNTQAFAISALHRNDDVYEHRIISFNNRLEKVMDIDFSTPSEGKNYAFEEILVAPDMSSIYLVGKAYFRKRRFNQQERRFQYELVRMHNGQVQTRIFDTEGKYSEAIKPLWKNETLVCTGFYANRKDNRYNGIEYLELNPENLDIMRRKYNPFTAQFMMDKFGKETEKVIKNLVFKGARFIEDGSLLFNAEEYFLTEGMQATSSGGRMKVTRFHYNDIVSIKLDSEGSMKWARNIKKTEVTQRDGAYVSYSSYTKDGSTYFFICSAMESPQLISKKRLIFKQGMSKNRNLFAIRLDPDGIMTYEKILDAKQARLPLMISSPLVDSKKDRLYFYAKHGTKKQLVSVSIQGETNSEVGVWNKRR